MTKKWNEIPAGSRVTLNRTMTLRSFNGEPRIVWAGSYFITGFWADIVGLNKKSAHGSNDVCLQARELVAFNDITV